MKTYKTILIGIVVLLAVLYGGQKIIKNRTHSTALEVVDSVAVKSVEGNVIRVFEGENVINYAFDIDETATTTVERDGSLIRVNNADVPVATMYISYEGGRGYGPVDYINGLIVPAVPAVTIVGAVTVGAHEWQKAESLNSEWYVAPAVNGQWLIIVENKKTAHDATMKILESLETN
jgi:hypothetical protein